MDEFSTFRIGCVVAAYLIGGIPTGVILSLRRYHLDVRDMGSGNIGATNVARVFGPWAGAVTLSLDFLKGYLPLILTTKYLVPHPWLLTTMGLALVLGHCFSPYLKLRGGKGVATSFGVVMATTPWVGFVAVSVYLLALAISRISAVGSLAATGALLVCLLFFPLEPSQVFLLVGSSLLVVVRHHSNILRLWQDVRSSGRSEKNPK